MLKLMDLFQEMAKATQDMNIDQFAILFDSCEWTKSGELTLKAFKVVDGESFEYSKTYTAVEISYAHNSEILVSVFMQKAMEKLNLEDT